MRFGQDDPPKETQTTGTDSSAWEWIIEQRAARWAAVLIGLALGFVSLTLGWWDPVCSQVLAAVGDDGDNGDNQPIQPEPEAEPTWTYGLAA